MNKILKIILFTLCIIFNTVTYSYSAEEHTAKISLEVSPSYVLEMPTSISIPYKNPDSIECCLDFPNLTIEEGYGLRVTISHDNFKQTENSSYEIPYNTDFKDTIITEENSEICFKVYVDKFYLVTSPPGKYTTKITVIIEYVKL